MKAFNGFKAEKISTNEPLPAGGYIAEIKEAKIVATSNNNEMLQISFDIAEGDKKEFFKKNYLNQTNEDKKWKGVYRLFIPKDDGSDKDLWAKRTFGDAIWGIEQSNGGYYWNWDETSLKGKFVGVLFRDKEWEWNGSRGWTTEACKLLDVDDVRSGNFKIPKAKELPKQNNSDFSNFSTFDDSDLPF
mgnify:CR=1 FL=1